LPIKPRPNGDTPARFTVMIGVILISLMFGLTLVFNLGLGVYTELLGAPGRQMEIIGGWHSGRHGCAGPAVESVLFDINIVCLNRTHRREFPEGGHMVVSGLVSPLGMNVESAHAHW
jgi:hypothetical protein